MELLHRKRRMSAIVVLLFVAGCESPRSSLFDEGAARCAGAERCDCFPDGSCQEGLTCLSQVCVRDGSAVPAGQAGASAGSLAGGGAAPDEAGPSGGISSGTAGAAGRAGQPEGAAGAGGTVAGGGGAIFGGSGGSLGGIAGAGGQSGAPQDPPVDTGFVSNGDFAKGLEYWSATAVSGGNAVVQTMGGALCLKPEEYQTLSVSWPSSEGLAFPVEQGAEYELSFVASAENATLASVKVNHAVAPFWPNFEQQSVAVGSSPKTYTFSFTPRAADETSGVTFFAFGTGGGPAKDRWLCLDNVTVRLKPSCP